ncbi:hypothetical protein Tco_0500136 [Tanacetum coccineum]
MEISIADQITLDAALVASADRLKIGKCNLRLSSDVSSKEATLQVVYDVLKLTPFYKAFQVTADAPEIYMQEFWASAYVHNRSVRFKMNNNFNTDIANHTSSKKDQIDNLLKERRILKSPSHYPCDLPEHQSEFIHNEDGKSCLEPPSTISCRFNTTAGNPVKNILLKLNLSDHRLFKMVVEVPDYTGSEDP